MKRPESFDRVVGALPEGGRLPHGQEFPFGTLRPVRDGFVERNGVKCWYAVYGEKGPWIAFAPIFQITPYAATYLARTYGLQYVGYYLCGGAVLSLAGLAAMRETKDDVLFSASAALPVT